MVFTDIDGTITTSDIRGHGAGALGYIDNHPEVAELFHAISRNGYKIVYMTARPIAMVSYTKDYLRNSGLPEGPFLCSDKGVATAFLTEMSGKIGSDRLPELKKTIIQSVTRNFDKEEHGLTVVTREVVYGAYGNRKTDDKAYAEAGIRPECIWIIDKHSVLTCKDGTPFQDGYGEKLGKLRIYYPRY